MSPAMILGTAGDHIEVVLGVVLGVLIILWALIAFVHWIRTTPWKRREELSEEERTIERPVDEGRPRDDIPHDLTRFAVR